MAVSAIDDWNATSMDHLFHDISKYYAANIVGNVLAIGKILHKDGMYSFARDKGQGPFNLVDPKDDVTRMIHVIGEIHPRGALDKILDVDVVSCLYLNENLANGEIEVRSIHKGLGTSIYTKQECPLIMWNPKYEEHKYFDVIDVQGVFNEISLKNSFTAVLAESLRDFELFPPLMNIKR